MNKLSLYDAQKLWKAQRLIREVADYNYTSDSNPLFRKLYTLTKKGYPKKVVDFHSGGYPFLMCLVAISG